MSDTSLTRAIPERLSNNILLWPACDIEQACGFYLYFFFFFMVALWNRADHYIFALWLLLSFFSSPNLSRRRLDIRHTSTHGVALVSANFRCRYETCCTRLAENTGRKKVAKSRHLGTIVQFCRAISSQLRHVSTIGKKLVKQQYVLHMSS